MEQNIKKTITIPEIKIAFLDIVVLLWWTYCIIRTYFVPGVSCSGEIASYSILFSLYILFRLLFCTIKIKSGIIEFAIIGLSLFEMLYGIWQLCTGSSNHIIYPITGTFFNPGSYSASVVIGMAVAMMKIRKSSSELFDKIYIIVLYLGCFILSITWSRSGYVSVIIVAITIFWDRVRKYKWLLASGILLLCLFLFYIKQESALGRVMIWRISTEIFSMNPIIGHGINGFESAYGEGLRCLFSVPSHIAKYANYVDVTEYAFNDLLQLAVEQGAIGLCFGIIVICLAIRQCWDKSKPLFFGILSLLIFAQFSYPFQLFLYQIFFVVCLAYSVNNKSSYLTSKTTEVLIFFFAIFIGGLSISKFSQIKNANEKSALYAKYKQEITIKDCYELLPYCMENKQFLFEFAILLREKKRYQDSNAILREGMKVSNDPMFLVVMGNNYGDMHFIEKADDSYKMSFIQMPNRLYPIYQRMKLYESSGDENKMRFFAKIILSFNPKIPSLATKQMKKEAREKYNTPEYLENRIVR